MEAAPLEGRSLDLCVGELVRVVAESFLPLGQQPGRPQGETVGDRVRTRGEAPVKIESSAESAYARDHQISSTGTASR